MFQSEFCSMVGNLKIDKILHSGSPVCLYPLKV